MTKNIFMYSRGERHRGTFNRINWLWHGSEEIEVFSVGGAESAFFGSSLSVSRFFGFGFL